MSATIEMRDGATNELHATDSLESFQEQNAEDAETLAALERLATAPEGTTERVGFWALRVLYAGGGA